MTFQVINGGGGGGAGGGGGGAGVPFKEHPLAIYLWRAIYPKAAINLEKVRSRMERISKMRITHAQVNAVLAHVRENAEAYGWSVAHVQKGSVGNRRLYFPIMVDGDEPFIVPDGYLGLVQAGAVSSARTLVTMATREMMALEIIAQRGDLDRADKRKMRAAASAFNAGANMITEVLNKIA